MMPLLTLAHPRRLQTVAWWDFTKYDQMWAFLMLIIEISIVELRVNHRITLFGVIKTQHSNHPNVISRSPHMFLY